MKELRMHSLGGQINANISNPRTLRGRRWSWRNFRKRWSEGESEEL